MEAYRGLRSSPQAGPKLSHGQEIPLGTATGVRRPVEGGALTSEAVLSRPTADTKLDLTLTDLGRGQVLLLTSPCRVYPLPL